MIKGYRQWISLREDGSQPALGLGHLGHSGHGDNEFGEVGAGSGQEASQAFSDLAQHIAGAMQGVSGVRALNAVISAILNEHAVPEDVKQKLKDRIQERWSHVVDLAQASDPGHGQGLANIQPKAGLGMTPTAGHIVKPSSSDGLG